MFRPSRVSALVAGALAALLLAASALAHSPIGGNLVTNLDHLDPGAPFTVFGSGLEAGVTMSFWLVTETDTWPIGEGRVAQDGTLEASFDTPADMPLGDAWVYAKNPSGASIDLYVHIGPRAVSPEATRSGFDPLASLDERTVGFGLLAAGLLVVLGVGARHLRIRARATPPAD